MATKDSKLSMRVNQDDLDIIQKGCELSGKNQTAFLLEAARSLTRDLLLDRTVYLLHEDAFESFCKQISELGEANQNLFNTLSMEETWEEILDRKK